MKVDGYLSKSLSLHLGLKIKPAENRWISMEALTYPYISLVLMENELNIDGYLWTSLLILRLGLKGKSIKFESRLASIEILTHP